MEGNLVCDRGLGDLAFCKLEQLNIEHMFMTHTIQLLVFLSYFLSVKKFICYWSPLGLIAQVLDIAFVLSVNRCSPVFGLSE